MKILWFTWKDVKNPLSGGAEAVNEELAKRLIKDGHQVIFLVAGFPGGLSEEKINGYTVIRLGNRWTVYWKAYKYYKKNLIGWADLVIDEVNTIPFFTKYYIKEKNILFVHQLCREIWFYEMIFPVNIIGYILEPLYLWLLSDRKVITVSESTKNDLIKFGFKNNNISIISEGITTEPVKNLELVEKFSQPTVLSLGSIRSMKRTIDVVKAFEIASQTISDLQLIMAGDANSTYGKKVVRFIGKSKFKKDIHYLGKIDINKKVELMQKAHLLVVASVKEGWGLTVTEANSQGTPAVVYNVEGLRDSVRNNETGIICQKNNPSHLANDIINLLKDTKKYKMLREKSWQWSKKINFEKSYRDFSMIIKNI